MLAHRRRSAAEYLRIWRRRWKLALLSLLIGAGAGYALARLIPPEFVSTATVTAAGGGSYGMALPSDVFSPANLSALRQQALTQPQLSQIAARYALFVTENDASLSGQALARIQNAIVVSPAAAGFEVSFRSANPRTAQQVCADLVSLLVHEESKILQRDAHERPGANSALAANPVADYLATQVADARRNLDEREARLAEFRRQHAGELAGAERTAAERKIAEDEALLQAADAALKRAMQQRTALTASLFTQQAAGLESGKPVDASDTRALEDQLAAKQAQLATLQSRYTPNHPDVVKLRGDIEQLQKKIEESRKAASQSAPKKPDAPPASDPRSSPQLQAQIQELDLQIQEKTREQSSLQQEIMTARSRLNTGSILDEQFRELVAEAASARTRYTGLQTKQNEAQNAAASEAREQQPLHVTVPPNLPERPYYPDPLWFTLAGAASGIAIGLIAAAAREMRDKSMRTARDVEFFLELPTLAIIPPADAQDAGDREGNGPLRGGLSGNRGEKQESVVAD